MGRRNIEQGFSIVEVLIAVVIAGLLGTVGWLIYSQQNNDSKQTTSDTKQDSARKSNANQGATSNKADTTIHDVALSFQSPSDISKLPDYTPASFKAYLLDTLQKNTPSQYGCIEIYSISKISQLNIKGGENSKSVSTAPADGSCESGAPGLWILTPAGTWNRVTLNGPSCKSENGGVVYEEFAPQCYILPDTSSFVKNPNGSITTATKE